MCNCYTSSRLAAYPSSPRYGFAAVNSRGFVGRLLYSCYGDRLYSRYCLAILIYYLYFSRSRKAFLLGSLCFRDGNVSKGCLILRFYVISQYGVYSLSFVFQFARGYGYAYLHGHFGSRGSQRGQFL